MGKVRLYCLPYAGGSASIYNRWKHLLPDVDIMPVELPGRGMRYNESFLDHFMEAVEHVYKAVVASMDKPAPYAIFGHSMGGLLAYELCSKLQENAISPPLVALISGRSAPHIYHTAQKIAELDDEEFMRSVSRLGGMTESVRQNSALTQFFLPVIRNDYRLINTYQPDKRHSVLNCPLSVLFSTADETLAGDVYEWRAYTTNEADFTAFPGGHFFIHEKREQVLVTVADRIRRYAERAKSAADDCSGSVSDS